MKQVKTIKKYRKMSIIDTIQYFLAALIAIFFGIGLVPFYYDQIFQLILPIIIIQIVISILRLRILNLLLEAAILILSLISIIPIVGYVFRFIGILASILEMTSFKNYRLYKQIEIRTFRKRHPNKKTKKHKHIKKRHNYEEAKFEER